MPIAVQWWAVWYPGSEPGGGSYIAQRMLASKSEKDALSAVLFFNIAHYVFRPWPWILVALCSLLVYPELSDIQRAFPNLDPKLLGHDIAYPAMLTFLPAGFLGPDGRRADGGELVDDPHAPQLGRVVSRARLLPPVRDDSDATSGTTCCAGRVVDRGLFVVRRRRRLPARHRQGHLRRDPPGRRRHRTAVSRALVLVARQRVVRDRGDGQLVRACPSCSSCCGRRDGVSAPTRRCS